MLPIIARVRASRRRSGPIRRRTGASRNAETQQTPTRMHSLHKSARSANAPSGTNTHSRTIWQRAHPSIRKRGAAGPPFSTTTHATAAEYAATSASAATTAPAAPAINNPGAATMHATAAIYAKATAYAMAIAIAALANDRPLPYFAMSFWMRSMASTVASASPKAVRRT